MKLLRNSKLSPKPRRTHHKKAFANPKTAVLITTLKREWTNLSKLERGNKIIKLVDLGCTLRGLTDDLDQPLTTIRRHIEFATTAKKNQTPSGSAVPVKAVMAPITSPAKSNAMQQAVGLRQSTAPTPVPVDRISPSQQPKAAISVPPSVKTVSPVVAVHPKRPVLHQPERSKILTPEELSDYVAQIIVDFLLDLKKQGKICKGDIKFLFDRVNLELERRSPRLRRFPAVTLTPREVIALCKPLEYSKVPGAIWIDFYVVWVAQIAYFLAPEKKTRDSALRKAGEQAFERCPA